MKRKFVTNDRNDREVPIGLSKYIWAFGTASDAVTYHNSNRGTDSALFRVDPLAPGAVHFGPSVINRTYLFTGYQIPTKDTTYTTKTFLINATLDIDTGGVYDIVAIEPVIHPATKPYVHHIATFLCPGTAPLPTNLNAISDSQNADGCNSMLFTWGVGAGSLYFPPNVGVRVNKRNNMANSSFAVFIQMHYTNLDHAPGLIDYSGIRVFYDSNLKSMQAATLMLGMSELQWDPLPSGQANIHRQVTCPSGCTHFFKEKIHVFASLLHMHEFGRKIYTAQYDWNGNLKGVRNRIDFWSFGNQQITPVDYVVEPGDRLQTHCIYDTSKWKTPIEFSEDSFTEMCFDIISYYPAQFNPDGRILIPQPFFNCGGYWNSTDKKTRSVCTSVRLSDTFIHEMVPGNIPQDVGDRMLQIYEPDSAQTSSVTEFAKSTGQGACAGPLTNSSGPTSVPGFDFELLDIAGMKLLWRRTGDTLKVRLEGRGNSWIGFGISSPTATTNKMLGAQAVLGMPAEDAFAQSKSCDVFTLGGFSVNLITRVAAPNGLTSCTYTTSSTKSVLEFEAKNIGGFNFAGFGASSGRRFLAGASNTVTNSIAAHGSGAFGQHSDQMAFSVDFATGSATQVSGSMKLAHAVLMILGFIVSVGFGATAAAYKGTMKEKWFVIHQTAMTFAVLFSCAGLGVIVPQVAQPMTKPHHFIGVAALALMLIQPILGVLRPHLPTEPGAPKTTKRIAWEYAHKNNGRLVFVLGVVNAILGAVQHGADLSPPLASASTAIPIFVSLAGAPTLIYGVLYFKVKLCSRSPNVSDEKQLAAKV